MYLHRLRSSKRYGRHNINKGNKLCERRFFGRRKSSHRQVAEKAGVAVLHDCSRFFVFSVLAVVNNFNAIDVWFMHFI